MRFPLITVSWKIRVDPRIYISGMRIVLCVFFFWLLVALPMIYFFVPPSPFLVGSWDHTFFQGKSRLFSSELPGCAGQELLMWMNQPFGHLALSPFAVSCVLIGDSYFTCVPLPIDIWQNRKKTDYDWITKVFIESRFCTLTGRSSTCRPWQTYSTGRNWIHGRQSKKTAEIFFNINQLAESRKSFRSSFTPSLPSSPKRN